jgi:hypothetical protein
MKKNNSERGIRPAFIGLMVLALALICVPAWLLTRRPLPPSPVVESPPPAETAAVEVAAPVEPATVSVPAPVALPAQPRPDTLEGQWGIQVSSVTLARSGLAVDVRYLVVDAERALLLAQGKASAYLIDEATGTKISLMPPSVPNGPGAAHSRARMARQGGSFPPSPNRLSVRSVNSLLLPNPGGIVKSGNLVSVVVGDTLEKNVRVN